MPLAAAVLLASALSAPQDRLPRFREETIDPDAGVGYAVTVADLNADGRPDVVAVTEQPDRVVWYENPSWKRRVIVEREPRLPVCIQPFDADGDGTLELVLGADWQPSNTRSGGTVWLLRRGSSLEAPWTARKIDEEPTMHRMRLVRIGGRAELACKTLHGRDARPGEGAGASLYLLRRPADPFEGPWTREIVQNELHITHNFWPVDWDGDGTDEILLAALEGVFLFRKSGDRWTSRKLADGDPEKRGAGEIKAGRLPGGRRYLATVEPWHGHQAVIYTEPESPEAPWKRRVLVERHKGGHAVWTADLTGTGVDSLVVGFRGIPEGKKDECVVYAFHPLDAAGERWERKVLDEKGLGCEDALAADLNGDGRPDVVGIGRSTHNVKIYWNEGRRE
jgi:hypothetical protein